MIDDGRCPSHPMHWTPSAASAPSCGGCASVLACFSCSSQSHVPAPLRLERRSPRPPFRAQNAGSLRFPDRFPCKRRPREPRPCIQVADVLQSRSSLVLLVELERRWREGLQARGPGQLRSSRPPRPPNPRFDWNPPICCGWSPLRGKHTIQAPQRAFGRMAADGKQGRRV